MNIRNINGQKNELHLSEIKLSDTLSQFMEKCNNNFSTIVEWGGGPDGQKGDKGEQGIPTKPKVPIHAWIKGKDYDKEIGNKQFKINEYYVDLSNTDYQEGHLIMLENGHVYILKVDVTDNFKLKPNFIIALQSLDLNKIIDGKTAYVHIAYANSPDGTKDFITDQMLRDKNIDDIKTEKFLHNSYNDYYNIIHNSYLNNRLYIGIYSDNEEKSYEEPYLYTWIRMRNFEYNVTLSNPISMVYVDENNRCIDKNTDSTLIYIYDDLKNISDDMKISISIPSENEDPDKCHFKVERENNINKVVFYPVVKYIKDGELNEDIFEFKSNEQYKFPITLTYTYNTNNTFDEYYTTVYWTLIQNKNFNVKVFIDKNIVNTSNKNQTFKVGYDILYPNGYKKHIDDNKNNNIGYKIILTNDYTNLNNDNVVNNWKDVKYTFDENKDCYVVLVDPKNSSDPKDWTIVDFINITTVNDSKYFELTKTHIYLPSNINGSKINPEYITYPIQSQMLLYDGSELINIDNYNFFIKKYDNNEYIYDEDITSYVEFTDGKFSIPQELIYGNTEIKCVAIYNGQEFQKTLYIELKETQYKFEFNKNVLTRKNNIIDDELIVYIKYYDDGKWKTYNDENINVAVKVLWNDSNSNYIENLNYDSFNKYYYININNNNFKNNDSINNVKICCYENIDDTEALFSEIIPIVNNGLDGKNGKDGANSVDIKKSDEDGINYWVFNNEWFTDDDGNKIKAEGKDGHSPLIGVGKEDGDECYYWTIDGKFLLDENNNKIKAEGKDGKDCINSENEKDSLETKDENDKIRIIIENNNIILKNSEELIVAEISSDDLSNNENINNYANIYTQIDKNGVVVKTTNEDSDPNDDDTIFNIKSGEILMQVGNFGIRITNKGIEKTIDGETWDSLLQ